VDDNILEDLSKKAEFGKFGENLNLKDFSISDKFLNTLYLNRKKKFRQR